MESLPLVPGYTTQDPTIRDFKLNHKCDFINGICTLQDDNFGIGGRPIDAASLAYMEDVQVPSNNPALTYGPVDEYRYQQFVPKYALFAQKCLLFRGFFREGVFNSPNEHYRIRHVNIIYFLEDNTMCVSEPVVDNAGYKQGKIVRRSKVLKNGHDVFHWKDLNVGIDICVYGIVYHIIDCDLFTQEFLSSQGIDVGDKEDPPTDPYTQLRSSLKTNAMQMSVKPIDYRRRFLEYDGMVLTFNATWNDDIYQLLYFLADDTIAIREIHTPNDGKDSSIMLLKRIKVPKNWKNLAPYPAIYMECSESETLEYYSPKDIKIGDTVFILGRHLLLYSCDDFTRKYYSDMLNMTQPDNIPMPSKESRVIPKVTIPPHIRFGSPEDTYASCLSFIRKSPKQNVIRQLSNFPKTLRYTAYMHAVHPEDKNRDFIMEYRLYDGKIKIRELEKRNSGRHEGCFLSPMFIPKAEEEHIGPIYYTPADFFIGAKINVFNHYFVISGADLSVYHYIKANPEKFTQEVQDNMIAYFVNQGLIKDAVTQNTKRVEFSNGFKSDNCKH